MGKLKIVAKNPEAIPLIRDKLTILLLEIEFNKEGKELPKELIEEVFGKV